MMVASRAEPFEWGAVSLKLPRPSPVATLSRVAGRFGPLRVPENVREKKV